MYIIIKISFLLILLISTGYGTSIEKDLTLTFQEKVLLDKFGQMMKDRLPHDYMRKDIYLIRWLRARNFDLTQAEQMLLNNLRWRKENKMDEILMEDFSDVEQDYKYWIRGFDVEGKPVVYLNFGQWNVRRAALSGSLGRNTRYLDRYLEEITTLIRKMQDEGRNVTQYSFVMNMDGFNVVEHACIPCLPGYLQFVNTYENYYPGAADLMFFVNTPRVFEVVFNAARFALSQTTRDALQIYGTNKKEWQPKLFSVIPRDQLPREVGGTQIFNEDDY